MKLQRGSIASVTLFLSLFPVICLISFNPASGIDFPAPYPICANPYWVEWTDQDLDGHLDLLAVADKENLAQIGIAIGNGKGQLVDCLT